MIYYFRKLAKICSVGFAVFCVFVECVFGTQSTPKKALIVYYSMSEKTKIIAEKIHNDLNLNEEIADIMKIRTVAQYPSDQQLFMKQTEKEVLNGTLPAIIYPNIDLNKYDVIVIGTPVWWSKPAPAIMSFVKQNDFSGKTVFVFMVHEGSPGTAFEFLQVNCVGAIFGTPLSAQSVIKKENSENGETFLFNPDISNWINNIKNVLKLNLI